MQQPRAISSSSLKKQRKNHLKKNLILFQKNSSFNKFLMFSAKKILYSMDQPRIDIMKNVLYSDSLYFLHSRKKNLCLSSRRFSYCSQPYWRFFSFSSSARFLCRSLAYWSFLSFFFQKDFDSFYVVLFEAFLYICNNS